MLGNLKTYPLSTVTNAGKIAFSSPALVFAKTVLSSISIFIAFVITGIPSLTESIGPTCAVSPSTLCLPQRIKSYSICFIAVDKIYDVASVSEPA